MEEKEQGFNINGRLAYAPHFSGWVELSVWNVIAGEEVLFEHTNSSPEDEEFDAIVSALEEILLDDNFQTQLSSFYQNNCGMLINYTSYCLRGAL
jgi:hypothetical protein